MFGDKITTDHISPAGSIKLTSPGRENICRAPGAPGRLQSYGTRRGNHEVMMRGTFANIRIKNMMKGADGIEGGLTKHWPDGEQMSIYDAAMKYQAEACRWWCSPARNTAPARRATGRPRAPSCSACAP
jgi:aconitate hydratase